MSAGSQKVPLSRALKRKLMDEPRCFRAVSGFGLVLVPCVAGQDARWRQFILERTGLAGHSGSNVKDCAKSSFRPLGYTLEPGDGSGDGESVWFRVFVWLPGQVSHLDEFQEEVVRITGVCHNRKLSHDAWEALARERLSELMPLFREPVLALPSGDADFEFLSATDASGAVSDTATALDTTGGSSDAAAAGTTAVAGADGPSSSAWLSDSFLSQEFLPDLSAGARMSPGADGTDVDSLDASGGSALGDSEALSRPKRACAIRPLTTHKIVYNEAIRSHVPKLILDLGTDHTDQRVESKVAYVLTSLPSLWEFVSGLAPGHQVKLKLKQWNAALDVVAREMWYRRWLLSFKVKGSQDPSAAQLRADMKLGKVARPSPAEVQSAVGAVGRPSGIDERSRIKTTLYDCAALGRLLIGNYQQTYHLKIKGTFTTQMVHDLTALPIRYQPRLIRVHVVNVEPADLSVDLSPLLSAAWQCPACKFGRKALWDEFKATHSALTGRDTVGITDASELCRLLEQLSLKPSDGGRKTGNKVVFDG